MIKYFRKYFKKAALLAGALVFCGIAVVYGFFQDSVTVTNRISTGDVRISLKEYQLRGGKEVPYTKPENLLPGDKISKIPHITNQGEPCWIRASVAFSDSAEKEEGLSEKNLSGFPQKWIKAGAYYYYTEVLEKKDSVRLFSTVEIPAAWTNGHEGQKLGIHIRVDAIQAANFSPNFRSEQPWGNQQIQECVHEEDGISYCRIKKGKLSVEFHGEAHRLIATPQDFFGNFSTAMPGDVMEDSVSVLNTTEGEAEIFFCTEAGKANARQRELLEKLKLTISMNGKTLYAGNLKAEKLSKNISLEKFPPGAEGKLDFTVSMPKELDNDYALRDAQVKWIFSVNEQENEPDKKGGTKNSNNKGGSLRGQSKSPVKTGDNSNRMGLLALALVSLIVIIIACRRRFGK